jgi:hypothetical protein
MAYVGDRTVGRTQECCRTLKAPGKEIGVGRFSERATKLAAEVRAG